MKASKALAGWLLVVVVGVVLISMYQKGDQNRLSGFDYRQFKEALENRKIKEDTVTFRAINQTHIGEIRGTLKEGAEADAGKEFVIVGDVGEDGRRLVEQNGYSLNYESDENRNMILSVLGYLLPFSIALVFLFFIFRQLQAGGGKAMSFGKSRAKLLTENKHKVTFKDVAGVDEAKQELTEIVDFLKSPKKYTRLGGKIPKGVLLVGPPGTGKTLLARAVAGEAGVPFFTISGSDFVEMFVGVGASRVRDLFEQGKKNAPCLIFIDEIDAVGRHRGSGMGGGHDEREQTLNQMLVEMDGFEGNDGVIIIAATNRPDVLDPALLRPGRFDRRVIVNKPDLNGREMILKVHAEKTPLASNVNLNKVARGTPGFSGADLANLVNESALNAARNDRSKITQFDFDFAKDKVMMGSERRSMAISEEDRKITAYHEAGHALVGKMLKGTDPLHKVTIIPRGMALGLTQFLPEKDSLNLSKKKAEHMIAMMFGGRVAEEIIFEDYTTGAGNDIERATDIARRMVCEWGMSEKLGPLAFEKNEGPVFLGMQSNKAREYSDGKAQEIDGEVHRIIMEGYNKAKDILNGNLEMLHGISESLLEFETIDGADVDIIIGGGTVDDVRTKIEKINKEMAEEQKKAKEEVAESEANEKRALGNPSLSDPLAT